MPTRGTSSSLATTRCFLSTALRGRISARSGTNMRRPFWDILVNENVLAYLCSHILAFDVQAHRGVLQICTAGAGTAHRMPEGVEYLHCVQAALDEEGLRYQVLDTDGAVRERLEWPLRDPDPAGWRELPLGDVDAPFSGHVESGRRIELRLVGQSAATDVASAQTILTAFAPDSIAPFWLGLRGPKQTLTAIVGRQPGRSPSYWFGPDLSSRREFRHSRHALSGYGPWRSSLPPSRLAPLVVLHLRVGARAGAAIVAARLGHRSRTRRQRRPRLQRSGTEIADRVSGPSEIGGWISSKYPSASCRRRNGRTAPARRGAAGRWQDGCRAR